MAIVQLELALRGLLACADCDGAGDSLLGVSSFLRLLSRGESMALVVVVLKEWQL
jgi:hypothetical protein